MVSNEIKAIYKDAKNIRKEYINQDSELEYILNWNETADSDDKKIITEEMKTNLREFYLNKIGEDKIKNSPDYDTNLVSVDSYYANIIDLNFLESFGSVFIKSFLIDLAIYLLLNFGAVILWWILGYVAWIGIIINTIAFVFGSQHDSKKFMVSSKKSESEKQKISRVKYAPILAFIIILLLHFISVYIANIFI